MKNNKKDILKIITTFVMVALVVFQGLIAIIMYKWIKSYNSYLQYRGLYSLYKPSHKIIFPLLLLTIAFEVLIYCVVFSIKRKTTNNEEDIEGQVVTFEDGEIKIVKGD